MKINKLIIRILHIFGFTKNVQSIDDITVNIPTCYPTVYLCHLDKKTPLLSRESRWIIDDIKEQITTTFKNDDKLEKRCRGVEQVWISFYGISDKKIGGIMKMLWYKDGSLYYPCKEDIESKERDMKIQNILNT